MDNPDIIKLDFNENDSIISINNTNLNNTPIQTTNNLMCKQTLLMNTLNEYFKDIDNLNYMIPIIVGKSNISLRILWQVLTLYMISRP